MNTIKGREIDKLLEDISSIKHVINKNKPLPVPISISITFGCGLLIFSAVGRLTAGADQEE